ncbi:MAG: hypothetical protein V1904_02200 [Bacteroidota bacterium]
MMRSIIRYCFICVFLFKGFQGKTEIPFSTAYADSIFNAGNYPLAALEYERIYFISDNLPEKSDALLKKSYCYKNLLQFDKATSTLNRIDLNDLSDSLQFLIRYEKALNSFLGGNYYDAQVFLFEIHHYTKDTVLPAKCLFLEILTENELQNWDEADSLFRLYLSVNDIIMDSSGLNAMLKRPNLLNQKTAKIISYFIPGSGQMMSGHIFRGMTSIIFQGSSAAFTYLSIKNGFYVSGFTIGLSIFQMFYTGGARYAYYLAEKKNVEKISKHNKKIRDFVLAFENTRK